MFIPLNSRNTDSTNNNQVNNMVQQLNKESQTKVFKGPNNVNSLITGKLPKNLGYGFLFSDTNNVPRIIGYIDSNNNPVFKISEAGVDVTTATNDQLNFNSDQNIFKIIQSGTITLNVAAFTSYEYVDFTHNLGFAPTVIAYVDYSGTGAYSAQLPLVDTGTSGAGSGMVRRIISVTTDTYKVSFSCYTPDFAANALKADDYVFAIKYYIIQETAN